MYIRDQHLLEQTWPPEADGIFKSISDKKNISIWIRMWKCNGQQVSIGLGACLAPTSWQIIAESNNVWCIVLPLGLETVR